MTTPDTTTRGRARRRIGLPMAVAGIAVLAATPAVAAVVIQNFVRADVTKAAACMTKIEGIDATTFATAASAPYVDVNEINTAVTADGVNLLNEVLTVKAFKGDRLFVTDGMRIKNACNYPITVTLTNEAQPFTGATATGGDWTDMSIKVYLGKQGITSAAVLNPALSGTNFATAADWDATPIHAKTDGATTAATVVNAVTGTATIAAGKEVQVGMLVDAGTTATATTTTLRFTVKATV